MPFIQCTLIAPKEEAEECSDNLIEIGALAVSFEDAADEPLFEPELGTTPLWEYTKIIGLFEDTADVVALQDSLKNQIPKTILDTLHIELIEDQNWIRLSLDQFKPQYFGNNLWICPTWCEIPAQETAQRATIVKLDPGLAFGTGMHPTTQLCLEWLANHPPKNALIVDYGCGSGILGIAAAKLGARQVIAIDHDSQALLSTRDNAKLNGLTASELCAVPVDEFIHTYINAGIPSNVDTPLKADLILANILADPLIQLAPRFATLLKPNGQIILSGILSHQIEAIKIAYQVNFKNLCVAISGDWARIAGVRK